MGKQPCHHAVMWSHRETNDAAPIKKHVGIHIGEFFASKEPAVIRTILGSCVAVCLYDPKNQIGGMNHILLPGTPDIRHCDKSARYGINAMEILINRIMNLGGDRRQLVAKVFGGGNVIASISGKHAMGEKNVSFALEFLQVEGFRILSKDVGGTDTRKIYFHTDTGDVFLKRILSTCRMQVAEEEEIKFWQAQKTADKAGEITLFE